MKLLSGVEAIDLALYTHNSLIMCDFHLGQEEAMNKQGILLPRFQFKEIVIRLEAIFKKLGRKKLDRIIINGDLKHEFGTISDQEWRYVLRILDFFQKKAKEIIIIQGNHDPILKPVAKKRSITLVNHYIIRGKSNKNILITHGDKLPEKSLLKDVETIIIGHEHPAVSIADGSRSEKFKCYLVGNWQRKNLIVQPSFNQITEGTDVITERLLSPFLKKDLGKFEVVVAGDKLYRFGKLKSLL